MNDTKINKKARGRPKSFERGAALEKAMAVFCDNGYCGTSVSQLTQAMNMKPPSLYAEFQDKETLFLNVLDHYHGIFFQSMTRVFEKEQPLMDAMAELFAHVKEMNTNRNSTGCLIVNSSIDVDSTETAIGNKIRSFHERNEALLTSRLEKAQKQGELDYEADIKSLARFLNGIIQGAAVLGRGQRSPEAVIDLIDTGLRAFKLMIAGHEPGHRRGEKIPTD